MTRTPWLAIVLALFPAGSAVGQTRGAQCAVIAALLGEYTGEITVARDTVVQDPRTEEVLPGCALRFDGKPSAWAGGASPDARVRTGLEALGWREHLHYAADGPDGTAFALWHESATCYVRAQWDGGDDADATYVPRDAYTMTVECVSPDPAAR